MFRFKLAGKPYELPASWAQVPARHLLDVLPARLTSPDNMALRVRLVCLLSGVHRGQLMRADSADVRELATLLDWVWTADVPGGLLQVLPYEGTDYLLPAADFSDLSLGEYIMVEHHLRQFTQAQSLDDLYQLVATVCRPRRAGLDEQSPDFDGDAREPYNAHQAARRTPLLMAAPLGYHQLVLAHVVAAQRQVHRLYGKLFSVPEGAGNCEADAVEGSPLLDLAYSLADAGVFGDFEHVCKQNIYVVLEYLDCKRRMAK